MRSPKLILVLILFGLGLIVAAVVPSDEGSNGLSTSGSWIAGLLGAASLAMGSVLLRRQYLAARLAQGGGPMPPFLKVVLIVCGLTLLAGVAYAVMEGRTSPRSAAQAHIPGTKTKADYMADEQAEIKRRQGGDKPAPAPGLPDHAFK